MASDPGREQPAVDPEADEQLGLGFKAFLPMSLSSSSSVKSEKSAGKEENAREGICSFRGDNSCGFQKLSSEAEFSHKEAKFLKWLVNIE